MTPRMPFRRVKRLVSVILAVALVSSVLTSFFAPNVTATAAPLTSGALQTILDLVAAQAAGGIGKVTALTSQISEDATGSDQRHTGTATYHIGLTDTSGTAIALDGPLTFTLANDDNASPAKSDIVLQGKLTGAVLSVDLSSQATTTRSGDGIQQTAQVNLAMMRNGKASNLVVKRNVNSKTLRYGVNQAVTEVNTSRDGQVDDMIQTLTRRDMGKGAAEIWLNIQKNGATDQEKATIDEHAFQQAYQDTLSQFIDRYDLQFYKGNYKLQAPATVLGSTDGTVSGALTLVDGKGQTLPITLGGSTATPSTATPGQARSIGTTANTRFISLTSHPARNMPFKWPAGPHGGAYSVCGSLTSNEGSFWIGMAFSAAALVAFGGELLIAEAIADMILGNLLTTGVGAVAKSASQNASPEDKQMIQEMTLALSLLAGFAGILTPGGVAGLLANLGSFTAGTAAGNACNADPYFVDANRSASAAIQAVSPLVGAATNGALTVVHVTGGLIKDVPVRDSSAVGVLQPPDNKGVFVGGSIPSGAVTIGSWTWSTDHLFGGGPTHTQAPTTSPERHYFIHAGAPLTLTADDNIIQYVFLDPKAAPGEIYLQFYTGNGDGERRAFWGPPLVNTGGKAGTQSLFPVGPIPAAGQWVRLQIPAAPLDLVGKPVNGILYGADSGQVYWGPTTTSSRQRDTMTAGTVIQGPSAMPVTVPGSVIAYQTRLAAKVSADIVTADGKPVRSLLKNSDVAPGYHVLTWDAKNDAGKDVPNQGYHYRFSLNGQTVAEGSVSVSPLTAAISMPGPLAVIRGNNVPIIGEAYGQNFKEYVVEYGAGLNPTQWQTITTSHSPALREPTILLAKVNAGNLTNWNTGLTEISPNKDEGLNGLYTLRLRVAATDGSEFSDSVPVVVGRLAQTATGGVITSPDGKAKLTIPPLSTLNSFALLALIPLSQLEPESAWRPLLPKDKQLAGTVYEVLPPGEPFRQAATLELPYETSQPADKVGIMVGDGTAAGWRYLGGKADSTTGTVSAPVTEFGGARAWVAVFSAGNFGAPSPYRTAPTPLNFTASAPAVGVKNAPVGFYTDFTSPLNGQWQAVDQFGTGLDVVSGPQAGYVATDNAALKVTRLEGGARLVQVQFGTPHDAAKYPILSFDYRAAPDYAPDVIVRADGVWWQIKSGNAGQATTHDYATVSAPKLTADDQWHHYQIDLLALLRSNQTDPKATYKIEKIVFGQMQQSAYGQVTPLDGGAVGSSYYLDNVAALAPVKDATFAADLSDPKVATQIDQTPDSVPAGANALKLPDNAPDGLWYVHVRQQKADGTWTSTAHYPILADRQPPALSHPFPDPGGAGSPLTLLVTAQDTSGIDLSSLSITINNQTFKAQAGINYDPVTNGLSIYPAQLKPALPPFTNGQSVSASVAVSDYAGNTSKPLAWTFRADTPKVTGQAWRDLKLSGTAPALSPDGGTLAYVAPAQDLSASKIWVADVSQFGDAVATSAHPLNNTHDVETDPVWSPDGKLLAYISNGGGSTQVWTANPDGGDAHAVTRLSGTLASPTFSPDSKQIAFVRDGNIWQVGIDGSGLGQLSQFPDQPVHAVHWQPGGQLLAVDFDLYHKTVDLFDPMTGTLTPLTQGGVEHFAGWQNMSTVVYAAPSAPNQPEALWQIGIDGSNAAMLPGSGQPGISDSQPAPAADGGALAMVSSRGGQQGLWLQATLQIAQFTASPSTGAAPGTPQTLAYSLPASLSVSIQVLKGDGSVLKTLLDKSTQSKGSQSAAWDGTDDAGKPVPSGDYTVRIQAQSSTDATPIERYVTVHVLDAANVGSLQLQVNDWADKPFSNSYLSILVYSAGQRIQPVTKIDYDPKPLIKLPAGQYDIVTSAYNLRREVDNVTVQAGQTVNQVIDLKMGGLAVNVLSAPGIQVADSNQVFVGIARADAPDNINIAFDYSAGASFVLPPGRYNIAIDYQNVRKVLYNVEVKTGAVTTQEINLGSGVLHLNVFEADGQPADPNLITTQVYHAGSHDTVVTSALYTNKFDLRMAEGRYDIRIDYSYGPGGANTLWLNNVEIKSGDSLSQDINLHEGQAKVDILEATGKPGDAQLLTFGVFKPGTTDSPITNALFTNTMTFHLPPGKYDIIPAYNGSHFEKLGPIGTIDVKEGQLSTYTFNMKAGRIQVQVLDASGQLLKADPLPIGTVYNAGKTDNAIAGQLYADPLLFIVPAGGSYDIVLELDRKQLTLANQTVKEGDTLVVKVNAADFK